MGIVAGQLQTGQQGWAPSNTSPGTGGCTPLAPHPGSGHDSLCQEAPSLSL